MTPDTPENQMAESVTPENVVPENQTAESIAPESIAPESIAPDLNGIGTSLTRKSSWEDDLAAYLSDKALEPFCWGAHDCALFAASAVEAMTGTDPAADFRGQYDNQAGARAALRTIGNGTLLKTYQARFAEIAPAFAKRGDLIWNGHAIGVCMGANAIFIGDEGLKHIMRSDWKRAFEVPFA